MSRRRVRTDQVERLIVPHDSAAALVEHLLQMAGSQLTLGELFDDVSGLGWPEPEVLLRDMLRGMSLRSIAEKSGRGSSSVLDEFAGLMNLLRDLKPPGEVFRDGDGAVDAEEFSAYLRRIADAEPWRPGPDAIAAQQPEWCRFHGSEASELLKLRSELMQCDQCPCMVPANPRSKHGRSQGRPRVFCSSACRQRGYRRRRSSARR